MEQGLHVDRQEELPTEAHEQGVPVVDIQEDEPGVVRSKSKRKLLKAVGKAAGPVLLAVGLATGGVGGVTPAEAGRPPQGTETPGKMEDFPYSPKHQFTEADGGTP